jgi:hypothetical protein
MFREVDCRFLLLQCHVPPRKLLLTLFTTGYKRLAEGGCQAFGFDFGLKRGFLMWKALEGKRIAEGKRIVEGELLEGIF